MKYFARLFTQLDQTTKTLEKVQALANYFEVARPEDKLWAIALLSHRRPKRPVSTTLLRSWAAESASIPLWLFEESYHIVGDLAETIALVLPKPLSQNDESLSYWVRYVQELATMTEEEKKINIQGAWNKLDTTERFVFNKFITGNFRVGVSQNLVVKALAKYTHLEESLLAHRLMGDWTPDKIRFDQLLMEESADEDFSKPYPFYLAYPLEENIENLGEPQHWQAERKWDGIRGQLIVRNGALYVWSRGEELITDRFPEYAPLAQMLPSGTVIDGEILPFKAGQPLPFSILQTRIGRIKLSKKILQDAPVILMAYDLLEYAGKDIRGLPLEQRRRLLEELVASTASDTEVLRLSPLLTFVSWYDLVHERAESRKYNSEGLMLKRKEAVYGVGRRKGDWWKWKIDPLSIDAVMIYAQQGHGRRANLFSDYTFAVWNGNELVPFAKAYSGLTDQEMLEVDSFVKRNTVERFGPVRSVKPELVFELSFEGIQASTRHKSGVALRFPRILRRRTDKTIFEANTLADLKEMLRLYGEH